MGKVIVFGSLNMDLTIECPRQPRMGETVTGSGFLLNPGGKGANQAVAASRLGADTLMIGAVGADVFGDALVTSLERAGVACGRIRHIEGISTGVASITRVGGDNCIVLDPGANHVLTGHDVAVALEEVATAGDVFVTQLECDLAATWEALACAHARGLYTIFNPAPAVEIPREVWPVIDAICLNETECEIVTGVFPGDEVTTRRALEQLASWGVDMVALTLGAQGSRVFCGGRVIESRPPAVRVVDTTGAGDTYIGALAMGCARELSLDQTVEWAICASALATARLGAQQAVPAADEVAALIAARR